MSEFNFKNITGEVKKELKKIGFDESYIFEACNKFEYKTYKIFELSIAQANILKQTALSYGADCAVHRETITGKIEKTDVILGGSYSQLKKIAEKLKQQPFKLKELGKEIISDISEKKSTIRIKDKIFDFSRPYVVGILNLGESFSDGYVDLDKAKIHLLEMIKDGADIIDIGAESTRPNSCAVADEFQIKKLLPILEFIKEQGFDIPVSIDTRSSKVAKICLENGADMINDVSGFDYDKRLVEVVSEFNCPIVIQHSLSTPDLMQKDIHYKDLVDDIFKNLSSKIDFACSKGIEKTNIIIDLGIGFGKTREQNIELLRRFEEFSSLKVPIMLGISRKSFLGMSELDNFTKDIYTLAINAILMSRKINFIRVHNVKLHRDLLNTEIL